MTKQSIRISILAPSSSADEKILKKLLKNVEYNSNVYYFLENVLDQIHDEILKKIKI